MLPLYRLQTCWIYLLSLFFYHLTVWLLEKSRMHPYLRRVVELFLLLVLGGFLFGSIKSLESFNPGAEWLWVWVIRHNILLQQVDYSVLRRHLLYFFFVLFLINECNHIIRYILSKLKAEPAVGEQLETDSQELQRGKIIGIIERTLFFLFVITGNYASIAFILTAKGITRFKELDDRNFAEYVLIGTLLSSAISIFWGLLALKIISV